MAEEIIEILEYIMNSPILNTAIAVYAVISIIVLAVVIGVFAVVVKSFFDINKRHRRR